MLVLTKLEDIQVSTRALHVHLFDVAAFACHFNRRESGYDTCTVYRTLYKYR